MFNAICDLTLGTFEHLYIMSMTDVDKRLKYTECILTGRHEELTCNIVGV